MFLWLEFWSLLEINKNASSLVLGNILYLCFFLVVIKRLKCKYSISNFQVTLIHVSKGFDKKTYYYYYIKCIILGIF